MFWCFFPLNFGMQEFYRNSNYHLYRNISGTKAKLRLINCLSVERFGGALNDKSRSSALQNKMEIKSIKGFYSGVVDCSLGSKYSGNVSTEYLLLFIIRLLPLSSTLAMFSCLAFLKAARNLARSLADSGERSLSINTVGKQALFSNSFLLNHTKSQSIRDRKRANIGRGRGGPCISSSFDVEGARVPTFGFPVR